MVLMIDNYDSFTYNLVQYLSQLGANVQVTRNDAVSLREIETMAPTAIVISPGPGRPADAGLSLEIVRHFLPTIPILGVCLGHQTLAEACGGRIVPARRIVHGKAGEIEHQGHELFQGVRSPFPGGRYHSLVVERGSFPDTLEIIAETSDDHEIMAIKHREYPAFGIQFHPESLLTPSGKRILKHFLEMTGEKS